MDRPWRKQSDGNQHSFHHARHQRDCDSDVYKSSAAQLHRVQLISGTNLSITASAYASQPCVLQESTNLVDWGCISTNYSDTNGLLQLSNMWTLNPAQKFFRLKSP